MQVDFFFAWLWVSNVFYGSGHFMVKKKDLKAKIKKKSNGYFLHGLLPTWKTKY